MPSNNDKQMITHRDEGYSEKMFARLNVFRQENIMIDLQIVVEGQEFGAHRVVMAAASDSFLQECGQSKVVLNNSNVSVRGFLPLLEYAYTSVLNVPQSDVTEVFLAAVHLHIQPVSDFLRPFTSLTGLNQATSNNASVPWLQSPDILRLLLLQYGNLANLDPSRAALLLNQLQLMQMSQSKNISGMKNGDDMDMIDANDDASTEKTDGIENDAEGSVGTHKNDSGVLSDRGSEEKEEWQDLQKLYGSAPNKIDPNGNSNNNCTALSTLPEKSSSSIPSPSMAVTVLDSDSNIPAPGTIVGRTRTGKPLTQPELPELPKTGQYMSVRRRTLQTSVPKPHVCQICGSRFTRYHNLKQHIKLHSGVKPYECDICGKRFTRNYTLRLHKMKHGGGQQFSCGSCSYTGNNPQEFKAHLRMHQHHPATQSFHDPVGLARYNAFDPSMLGPGVNSLLALAAQQKEQQKFFSQTMPSEGPSSPVESFGGSSPPQTKSEGGTVEEMNTDDELENGLQIDEVGQVPLEVATHLQDKMDIRPDTEAPEVHVQ